MSESFGARLRHRREQQGISVRAIADQTKIKSCLLESLERDDVSRWPTGIFRRAYFRSYAQAIGADVDAELREFLALHPDPHDVEDPIDAAAATTRPDAAPPTRIGIILSSAMAATSWLRRSAVPAPSSSVAIAPAPPTPELDAPLLVDDASAPIADGVSVSAPAMSDSDLQAVARLCTSFGRATRADDVQPLLREAAAVLDARGLIVWIGDEITACLRPALAHGYSRRVLARLSPVHRDADNPTATAFRSASTVGVSDDTSGALVVPLLAPAGCAGVLALELPRGAEQAETTRAVATIVAAMLVPLTGLVAGDRSAATPALPEPRRAAAGSRAASASCR